MSCIHRSFSITERLFLHTLAPTCAQTHTLMYMHTHTLSLIFTHTHTPQMNDDPKNEGFWGPLGGYTDPATLPSGESDADVVVTKVTKLFQLGAEAGADAMDLVSEGPLAKSMLKSTAVYLLHSTDKLYVWVGKDAELETKRRATQAAVDYIKKVCREDRNEDMRSLLTP